MALFEPAVVCGPRRPRSLPAPTGDSTFWLVETDPPIVWNGDARYAARSGEDHPLCHPIEPTRLALVMAQSRNGAINLGSDFSVPMLPVLNATETVGDSQPSARLGAKVSVYRDW